MMDARQIFGSTCPVPHICKGVAARGGSKHSCCLVLSCASDNDRINRLAARDREAEWENGPTKKSGMHPRMIEPLV